MHSEWFPITGAAAWRTRNSVRPGPVPVWCRARVKVVLADWMPLYHVRYGAQTHLAERYDERTRRRAGSLLSSRSAAEGIRVNIAPLARIAASRNALSPHEAPVPAA